MNQHPADYCSNCYRYMIGIRAIIYNFCLWKISKPEWYIHMLTFNFLQHAKLTSYMSNYHWNLHRSEQDNNKWVNCLKNMSWWCSGMRIWSVYQLLWWQFSAEAVFLFSSETNLSIYQAANNYSICYQVLKKNPRGSTVFPTIFILVIVALLLLKQTCSTIH